MVKRAEVELKEGLRGGKGCAEVYNICSPQELFNNAKMYAKVALKPNSSVGWHRHTGDTEPYYILEGEGVFIDNDKSETVVKPGDVCIIEEGQCHSIENRSDKDLVFMALVINK